MNISLADRLAFREAEFSATFYWISAPSIITLKILCINARLAQKINYSNICLIQEDVIIMLQFFIILYVP
jgi:hypothetical protein